MIPILYEANTKTFNTNGIGRLADAISCVVTEERNGQYELQMEYPLGGALYSDLKLSRIIWALPSDGEEEQAFRIYKITRPISGIVVVYAEHISYQLSCIPVSRFTASSAAAAMDGMSAYAAEDCPFTFWTDVTTSGSFAVDAPAGIRSRLGGSEGSVLDVFGGEYKWDNYVVRLYANRGRDNGVTLRYGKNITDLKQEENITNTITGVYPYWSDSEGNYVELNQKVVLSDKVANYPYPRIETVSCAEEFETQPTQAELLKWAQDYINRTGVGIPSVSIDVSFVALWQTDQYKDIAPLERVKLCDTVTIEYEKLGVSAKAKVITTEYDVLTERYTKIKIGEAKSSLTEIFASQQEQIEKKPSQGFMQEAIENATNWIVGAKGGYVIFRRDANDQPYEILIMDTPDINTATKVWRWNQGGLGYSSSGYEGPYTTAITQDGSFVADFITTGTMRANIIKGGTLTLGGSGNGNGYARILDANGTEIARIDSNGITTTKGSFSGTVKASTGEIGGWLIGEDELYNENGDNRATLSNGTNGNQDFIVVRTKDASGNMVYPFWVRANGQVGINLVDQSTDTPAFTIGNTDGASIRMGGDGFNIDFSTSFAKLYYWTDEYNCRLALGNNGEEKLRLDSDGMIQTKYPFRGSEEANVWMNDAGVIMKCSSSTKRIKNSITEDLGELDPEALYDIPVKAYKYNDGYLRDDDPRAGKMFIGLLAEDVAEIYPIAADMDSDGKPSNWNSRILLPAMLRLIQKQNERIKSLEEWKNEVIYANNGQSI